ncbi:chaperone modulator CbpM [Rhodoferax sp.]|uniref:chaperone modulator CbpM n=1 Tax=Rhodoferax sp. TaxID=50421 RepID=UPI00374DCC0C
MNLRAPIHEEETGLTLADLCQSCRIQTEVVLELVEEGVLSPQGDAPAQWRFTGVHVQRTLVAVRLQRDLGVNHAGAALALQLLEEIDTLRARLQALEQREQA